MLGEDIGEWAAAIFHRAAGTERLRVLLVDDRAPTSVGLPVDEGRLEEFRLDSWVDGEPVYRSIGFSARG